jgi:Mn-containing catalase
MGEEWQTIEDPLQHVRDTNGLLDEKAKGTERTEKSVQSANKELSAERKQTVDKATAPKNGIMSWSVYQDTEKLRHQESSLSSK